MVLITVHNLWTQAPKEKKTFADKILGGGGEEWNGLFWVRSSQFLHSTCEH